MSCTVCTVRIKRDTVHKIVLCAKHRAPKCTPVAQNNLYGGVIVPGKKAFVVSSVRCVCACSSMMQNLSVFVWKYCAMHNWYSMWFSWFCCMQILSYILLLNGRNRATHTSEEHKNKAAHTRRQGRPTDNKQKSRQERRRRREKKDNKFAFTFKSRYTNFVSSLFGVCYLRSSRATAAAATTTTQTRGLSFCARELSKLRSIFSMTWIQRNFFLFSF